MTLSTAELALSGAIASIAATASLHPLDTIKTVQQASPARLNALSAFLAITRKSGIAGLYAGVLPFLVAEAVASAIKFSTFELLLTMLSSSFVAAAIAFMACSIVVIPGEYIKAQLQTGQPLPIRRLFSGKVPLFIGADAVLLRDIPYTVIELGLYNALKQPFMDCLGSPAAAEVLAAAIAGAAAGWFTNPMDVLKTKMMATANGKPLTITEAAKDVYWTRGWQGFHAGSLARVAWVVPYTIIYLQTYEYTKRLFLNRKMQPQF